MMTLRIYNIKVIIEILSIMMKNYLIIFNIKNWYIQKHIADKLKIPYMVFDINTNIDGAINFIKKTIKDRL